MLYKFLKFSVVGLIGIFIDYLITYLCKEKFKLSKYLSNSLGFILAATSNYFLNRIWTFESNNPQIIIEFSSFIIISIVGLLINNFLLYLLHEKTNTGHWISNQFKLSDKLDYPFYINKFIAIIFTSLWNFYANYYITFSL